MNMPVHESPPAPSLTAENYSFLQRHIQQGSGIVIESGKHYLLEARLMPIARRENLRNLDDLCALLRATAQHSPIRREVVDAMTTNETLFFRDLAPFEALKKHILPLLKSRKEATRRLRLWSAAASTGQEAYSLAMLLLENGLAGWNIEILGTDIAEPVLAKARTGRYTQLEVNRGLPVTYLVKYFTRQGLEWQIKDEVRKAVRFERFDLRQSTQHFGQFDIIFCRNVLIYFDTTTKKQILRELASALAPVGFLTLGAAETTINLNDRLQKRAFDQVTFYQNQEQKS